MRERIETEHLLLRVPEKDDASAIVRYYLDNRAHLEPWSPTWPPDFFSDDFWREQIRLYRADLQAGMAVRFFVWERRRGSDIVGNLALTQIFRGPLQACSLGYGLAEAVQGRGYMQEAVRAAVDFAFSELGLHRVTASYVPHNVRSAAVLRRAGFTVEGYARDYLLIDGRWQDHLVTSVVNPAWSQ
ncbi:MAG: GNAT family N-acetyltransferase [Candidatus Dormibacteraeota bacterium]|nr:GNAT family N-acetyltransferase [Candidatus Dormibacteraeota bacterium]